MKSKTSIQPKQEGLVWVDLEMTGLDVFGEDRILEIAVVITDTELNHVADGPDTVIHAPDRVLDNMNEWCTAVHGKSGLTTASRNSDVDVTDAEEQVLSFVRQHLPHPKRGFLAGNSVHMDKMFLQRYMPRLMDHLHYRIVDVSTVKQLCRWWAPQVLHSAPRKGGGHRARADIEESMEELRHYRRHGMWQM